MFLGLLVLLLLKQDLAGESQCGLRQFLDLQLMGSDGGLELLAGQSALLVLLPDVAKGPAVAVVLLLEFLVAGELLVREDDFKGLVHYANSTSLVILYLAEHQKSPGHKCEGGCFVMAGLGSGIRRAMFYYSISMKGSKEGIRQIVE